MEYDITAIPMTYLGRDGRQYVAVTAARAGFGPGGGRTKPGREGLFVFRLPD